MNCVTHHICDCLSNGLYRLKQVEEDAVAIIESFIAAFRAYDMDVEGDPPPAHRKMMERAEAFMKENAPKG